jgi:hypothetical protein
MNTTNTRFILAVAVTTYALGMAGCGGEDPLPPGSADADGDGIVNSADACVNEPETFNNYNDSDGCPDTPPSTPTDTDRDGIPDTNDSCPTQPETQNGYQDSDGCPDTPPAPTDGDRDGIPDSQDACPAGAEVVNNYQDSDGCPDVNPAFNARWSGTVTITVQNEAPLQFTGTMNGTANGFSVRFVPVCPLGDGTMNTNTYTDQYSVRWDGTLACAPVAFSGGCQSVVFTFNSASFALAASNGNLGAAGSGTATGCGISKPFVMTFSGARQ